MKNKKDNQFEKRPGKRLRGDPEAVTKELLKIRSKHGKLTTQIVLDEARNRRSLLHNEFEWDDTIAAEKYRRYQAASLITAISIREVNKPDSAPVRMFVGYYTDDGDHEYQPREIVIQSQDLCDRALAAALKELEDLRAKFEEIEELASVWKELDKVKKSSKKVAR